MFAVFEAKGFQYLGSPGEKLKIPRLDREIGQKVTFDKVLLVKNGDTKIGRPYIEGASITAKIIDHGRYKKIIVFKFKKRNRYKRTRGHRQAYTEIEIKDIILGSKTTTTKKTQEETEKVEKDMITKEETRKIKAEAKKKTATREAKKAKKPTAKKKKSSETTTKARKKADEPKKKTKKTVKKKEATAKKKKSTAKSKKASDKSKKTEKSTDKLKKKKK